MKCVINYRNHYFKLRRSFATKTSEISVKKEKVIREYYSPTLNSKDKKVVKSVVGFNINHNCVSWARYDTSNNVVSDIDLKMLPEDFHKFDLHELYLTVEELLEAIPNADKYCLESLTKQVGRTAGKLQLSLHANRMQLTSMLVALLNHQNKSPFGNHCFLYLKQRIAARLFDILVGTEQVSAESVIRNLLSQKELYNCVPFTFNSSVISAYNLKKSNTEKELLSQAVLLTVCCVNIAVYSNAKAINKLLE